MHLAVYTLTRDRLSDTKKAIAGLREMAGVEFDHFIFDNGSTDGTVEWLKYDRENSHKFEYVHYSPDNKGQCIASNIVIHDTIGGGYDYICRYDNDIIPQTMNFLAELVKAQRLLGGNAVVSPSVEGLLNMPQAFGEKQAGGYTFGFVEILGGACRLMPAVTLKDFRFTEHGQLSLGEATKFSDHCKDIKAPMAYVRGIVVKHDTAAHIRDNPAYFKRRAVEDFIPYGL
jgi:glycosyltransferase involved in cell wall biosynthesis